MSQRCVGLTGVGINDVMKLVKICIRCMRMHIEAFILTLRTYYTGLGQFNDC